MNDFFVAIIWHSAGFAKIKIFKGVRNGCELGDLRTKGILISGWITYHHKLRLGSAKNINSNRFYRPSADSLIRSSIRFPPEDTTFLRTAPSSEDKLKFSSCIMSLSFDRSSKKFDMYARDSLINLKNGKLRAFFTMPQLFPRYGRKSAQHEKGEQEKLFLSSRMINIHPFE